MASSFTINLEDLTRILANIKIAEQNAGNQDLNPGAVNVVGQDLLSIIGQDAALLPLGLRTVSGINNHLLPGQSLVGAADQPFPRLLSTDVRTGVASGVDFDGDGIADFFGAPQNAGALYSPTGTVVDSAPRTISNLIVDQSINNPAAVEAWFANPLALDAFAVAHPGMTPMRPGEAITDPLTQLTIDNTDLALIQNQSPDIGLSPSFNGFMTFFGQFFDHGLDLVPKGGNGNVYIPLLPDDPLYVEGSPTNFMVISRVQPNAINITTPFVDQNQTYTSHASHQVFLREYAMDGGIPIATGRLLSGANHGLPTWAEVKAQAADLLGIQLLDKDVFSVPLLATDEYGRFIRGAHGFVQIVTATGLVEANPADNGGLGTLLPANTIPAGTAFLDDIAHDAAPGAGLVADADNTIGGNVDGQTAGTYDDELLNQHFITGDGRGNENIGLTTVHTVFHNEHDRLVEANKATILASGDLSIINQWLAPNHQINALPTSQAQIDGLIWNGERLFQAARFVTEMQYQHLVFEEFARKIQPNVDPFVFTNSADLNPAIIAEFAHTVYRFGHSMLNDTVDRLGMDLGLVGGTTEQIGLIEAFLNPTAFTTNSNGSDGTMTAADVTANAVDAATAAGAILRGVTRQVGNEIDEFVVNALRNNLVGLPLDLAAINMARGRDAGIPSLNNAGEELYAMTGDAQLKPYTSWFDFAQNIKHPESIINFIAAYGTHPLITAETTLDGKRAAALAIVFGTPQDVAANPDMVPPVLAHTISPPSDALAFLNGTGAWGAASGLGGLDNVDLWIGGLAEELMEFGGMLGSTFGAVFEYQMEHLQNGDRFYYLSRTQGMNLLNQLEATTFADLVMRNTDLGDAHSTHIAGAAFGTPDFILELDPLVAQDNPGLGASDPTWDSAFQQLFDPKVVRVVAGTNLATGAQVDVNRDGVINGDDNLLKFSGGEHVVLGGTEGNDTLIGDKGIDTLWGDGGDDYINAGMESDQVFGGEGDDIIEDPFGDNFLRGNQGNDVISSGHGLSLLFGDQGQDFIRASTDTVEIFAGEGNDFLLGGSAPDVLMGNEGDDWIEGGEGFDGLAGENSELFFNSPIIGHDVLNGQGNDTDYDGESGDDIMFLNSGITRANGMLGFDWVIKKGDNTATINPDPDAVDLGISRFATQAALILRDRNDSVEAASGWKFDDVLIGTSSPTGANGDPGGGIVNGPVTDSMLLSQNVRLINGLGEFLALTPGALRGQIVQPNNVNFASLPTDTTVFDPTLGGDILLGGGGSDVIYGKAGDDLIDGDRWLNVKIAVHTTVINPITGLFDAPGDSVDFTVDSLNEISARLLSRGPDHINPGQLQIVREIITDGATASDNDVAQYAGELGDFSIVRNLNGTVTVTDNVVAPVLGADGMRIPLLDDEGTDTLSNIETLRFTTYDANGIPSGFTDVSLAAPTGGITITSNGANRTLTADRTALVDLNGTPNAGGFSYQWQRSVNGLDNWGPVGNNSPNFNVPNNDLGFFRVIVTYTDGAGIVETLMSQNTARVGSAGDDTLSGTNGANLIVGLAGSDTLNGGDGNDVLNAGTGADNLNGDAGNDRIVLAVDNVRDVVNGGADNDTVDYSAYTANLTITLNGTTATVVTGSGTTAANSDTIVNIENATGGSGNDTLNGDGGNNILNGGAGFDLMTGGLGDDTYVIDDVTGANRDQVVEDAGAAGGTDTVVGSVNLDLTNFANVENVTLVGPATLSATGDGFDNVLTGGAGNNALSGGGGTDTAVFTGTVGGHRISANAGGILTVRSTADGTDTLTSIERLKFGEAVFTPLIATAVATLVAGGASGELIFGLGGNDTINADGGDDAIVWNVGDDRDTVNGGTNGTLGDTFIVNGNNTIENFAVYSKAAAIAAGFTVQSATSDIVVTRNGVMIAELDEIEEITFNTGGGDDTVQTIGNFDGTNLAFNTISINDEGGVVTANVSQMASAHRVVLNSTGGDDQIVGQRTQDLLVNDTANQPDNWTIYWNGTDDLNTYYGGAGHDTLQFDGDAPIYFDLAAHSFEEAHGVRTDADGSQTWSQIDEHYDTGWRMTNRTVTNDDQSSYATTYDVASGNAWDFFTYYFNSLQQMTGAYIHGDQDNSETYAYDAGNASLLNFTLTTTNNTGEITNIYVLNDDGSNYGYEYDVHDNYAWTTTGNIVDNQGRLTQVQTINDDGTRYETYFDVSGSGSWSTYRNYLNLEGTEMHAQDGTFDDGTSWKTVKDVSNVEAWDLKTELYDTNNNLLSTVFNQGWLI